jgi:3-hydroxyisobutyrate dehydrogenase
MKVGFIGLGKMGQGMARNLLKAGVELVVFDASSKATASLVEAGAIRAESVASLVRDVSVVFTSLPGPVEVEAVVLGPCGILENASPGLVLFDLSTSSFSLAQRISNAFAEKDAFMLDAPVSGGPAGAASGQLALWVSGNQAAYERNIDLLKAIANVPKFIGPIGAGTATKLVHNLACCMIFSSLAEVFSLGVKAGVEPFELWDAMRSGVLGKLTPMDMVVKQFLPGKYMPPAMALKLAHKDVSLATALARELDVPMRMANLTLEEMTEAIASGLGNEESRAFMKVQLQRVGLEIEVNQAKLDRALGGNSA